MNRYTADVLERVGWTAAEAIAGLVVVDVGNLDVWWAAPVAVGAALLKAFAAKRVGAADSASTLPARLDPPGPRHRQP